MNPCPLEMHVNSKLVDKRDEQRCFHKIQEPIPSQNIREPFWTNCEGILRSRCDPLAEAYIFTIESDNESSSDEKALTTNNQQNSSFVCPLPQLVTGSDTLGIRFIDPEKINCEFHIVLLTKGGGGRRNTPVKGDLFHFVVL